LAPVLVRSQLLEKLVLLIPQLIAAAIIMLVGWGIAAAVSRAVQRTLYQEEFERARLVGRIVRAAIIVVASAIALVELDVAQTIFSGAFVIAFGARALSFVCAFGLGTDWAANAPWKRCGMKASTVAKKSAKRRRKPERARGSDLPARGLHGGEHRERIGWDLVAGTGQYAEVEFPRASDTALT
jgi:hypothetical protein